MLDQFEYALKSGVQFGTCLVSGNRRTSLSLHAEGQRTITVDYTKKAIFLPSFVFHSGVESTEPTAKGFFWVAERDWEKARCPYSWNLGLTNLFRSELCERQQHLLPILHQHYRSLNRKSDTEEGPEMRMMKRFAKKSRTCEIVSTEEC